MKFSPNLEIAGQPPMARATSTPPSATRSAVAAVKHSTSKTGSKANPRGVARRGAAAVKIVDMAPSQSAFATPADVVLDHLEPRGSRGLQAMRRGLGIDGL